MLAVSEPLLESTPEGLAEIYRFRAVVWQETGMLAADAFGNQGWRDPIDEACQHWVIRSSNGELAAAGRLSIHPALDDVHQAHEYTAHGLKLEGPIAAPDRVVVSPRFQGCGLGWKILEVQENTAAAQGARWAVRQASPAMVKLITRRGWQIAGLATPDTRFPGASFQVAYKRLCPTSERPISR